MAILFISDLHLSPTRPRQFEQFCQLLRGPARTAEAVYILGDLFEEFWAGIDDDTPPNPAIIAELRDCTRAGTRICFQRGNRDLLVDEAFVAATGCQLLADRAVIELGEVRTLLTHGDLLCTRDRTYQLYRRAVIHPWLQGLFRALPRRARIGLTRGLRPLMNVSKNSKPAQIMDVDDDCVNRMMTAAGVTRLIHGHTHRPGRHELMVNGHPAERIVLGDWYGEGLVLVWEGLAGELSPLGEYLQQQSGR